LTFGKVPNTFQVRSTRGAAIQEVIPFRYKQALVTGGAGFIGSHLVDSLVGLGCKVNVLDDLSTGSLSNLARVKSQISFFEGDIRDGPLLSKVSEGCDILFHQAAIVSVPQTVEQPVYTAQVNELGTLCALEAARNCGVKRVIIASSCAVYGNDPRVPKHESMEPCPESPYAVQKLNGEQHARLYWKLYGVETICLRYFNVYGPRQNPGSPYSGVISIFLNKAAAAKPPEIHGNGTQSRDFIFVADVVKANLLAAAAQGVSGVNINVGTGKPVTINALWKLISHIFKIHVKPRHTEARAGDVFASAAGTDFAASALGFKPEHSLEKGLRITFKWHKKVLAKNGYPRR